MTEAEATIAPRLRITEIFHSLQGEARDVGRPTVFVRLTGCPLRCVWCDTTYSFHGGEWRDIDAILDQVKSYGARHVCVTGGEPLAQKRCIDLLRRLCDAGYDVSLETSGAIDVSDVDPRVSRVVDVKAPGSGEVERNLWSNLDVLTARDQIKFVLADRVDYDWARDVIAQRDLSVRCDILLSPVHGKLEPRDLAEWILTDRLPVRMQIQLHKLLWGETPGT
jgi:7-carboxy-7-deazaguanine synthase